MTRRTLMDMPPVDPINPQQTDAATGSVFTGAERQTRIQALSLLELLIGFGVLVLMIAIIALTAWIL